MPSGTRNDSPSFFGGGGAVSGRDRGIIAAAVVLLIALAAPGRAAEQRLLFTGDILLGREVAHEVRLRGGASPWQALTGRLAGADLVFGNFEGSVGDPRDCPGAGGPCLVTEPEMLPFLKRAGFSAIGIANNHSADLGARGRAMTRQALTAAGVVPLGFDESPGFVRWGNRTVALLSLTLVPGRDGQADAVPSPETARRLRLARTLADWVVVSVHWGAELADWVGAKQRVQAAWLVDHGADLIVGHHPHVVQAPECVGGRPVFFSLGNHVFDQKYPATKQGLIAECRLGDAGLSCRPLPTRTGADTSFPEPTAPAGEPAALPCSVAPGGGLTVDGWRLRPFTWEGRLSTGNIVLEGTTGDGRRWRTLARPLLSLEAGALAPGQPALLFTVERQPSSLDGEDGPRPYVYQPTGHGLVARWRGSALAWPLIEARLIRDPAGQAFVCARHRADSFILLDPAGAGQAKTRTAVYAWNGFGFSGVTRSELTTRCDEVSSE